MRYKNSSTQAKVSLQVLQNCILRVLRNILGFFLKKLVVVNHIRTLSEYCSAYWLNFPIGAWKLLLTFREEHFTEIFFNLNLYWEFSTKRYKISSLQTKISLQGFQSCILSVRLFFEILPTAFWWLRFTFREKFFEEKYFFGKNFNFITFSDIELSFLSLLAKISRQNFQNCFLRVQRNILREISFGEKIVFFYQCSCIERESFGNLAKILGHGRQNGILRVRKKSLKTICFSERVVNFLSYSYNEREVFLDLLAKNFR